MARNLFPVTLESGYARIVKVLLLGGKVVTQRRLTLRAFRFVPLARQELPLNSVNTSVGVIAMSSS